MSVTGSLPTGATRIAAVIGSPVRHSLSPIILNAAFQAAGLDWVYGAFDVADQQGAAAIEAMRTLRIGGLSVTMPHKAAVAEAVDICSPEAAVLGAVNCVAWQGQSIVGYNTDGAGFIDALRIDEGWDPDGRSCTVVGAGGAARAVIAALLSAGAASITVVNRNADRAHRAAQLAGTIGRVGSPAAINDSDLVVNATPIGMGVSPVAVLDSDAPSGHTTAPLELPFDPELIGSGQLFVDLVYEPLVTPAVQAATDRGAIAVNGIGMLIHQAAHAFRYWTGEDPPLEAMSAAVLAALSQRHR